MPQLFIQLMSLPLIDVDCELRRLVNLLGPARTRSVSSSGRSVEVPPTKDQAQRGQLSFETVDFESTETIGRRVL